GSICFDISLFEIFVQLLNGLFVELAPEHALANPSALAGLIIAGMGFAGTMTTSAIKRDRGVGDYGALVEGHNGVLDRIDSLCFAAPVFFHYVWISLM
ncbi:MAG: phosphatidate cytidylyltransferase, partial [Thermoguttaceae bacterium]|nr:phosphatidate cytidylyltransferase [Thermoguttaceae bacterium]